MACQSLVGETVAVRLVNFALSRGTATFFVAVVVVSFCKKQSDVFRCPSVLGACCGC